MLGQLLPHTTVTGQLQPTGLGQFRQLGDQLLIQAGSQDRRVGASASVTRDIISVIGCHFHDRKLHRTFYSPGGSNELGAQCSTYAGVGASGTAGLRLIAVRNHTIYFNTVLLVTE
jgi:hypothetical protein